MSTGLQCKRGRGGGDKGGRDANEKVVVAVKASKEISKSALVWALTHVVQPGNCLTLLVVMPQQHSSGRKLWGFPRLSGDCASGHRRSHTGTTLEQKSDLTYLCSQMMLQLHNVYDPNKINVKVKVLSGSPSGIVAAECKRAAATWVILDKQLKHEERRCMEDLQCNIVVMKRSQAKVLRLNLVGSPEAKPHELFSNPPSESVKSNEEVKKDMKGGRISIPGPTVTPSSSPEVATSFTATEAGTSSMSSSDPGTSPFFISETEGCLQKPKNAAVIENQALDVTSSDSDSGSLSPATTLELQPWMVEILSGVQLTSNRLDGVSHRATDARISKAKALLENYCKPARQAGTNTMSFKSAWDFGGSFRETVSRTRNPPPVPPPLCSICQHKAPVFGKPPRWFSYSELELATGGFSQANFLAEGGFGSVHRGILPDGQAIAVKQHKLASSQGDHEFCAEVEVLSCAQHRNLVMLIGFCVEERRRLLVYEYICNGSLDSHLYGRNREPLGWSARYKIAVGAARGLRYLHEECRVGCIVHRDMRPNNILITHDFEPLVGDFGLARWQPDGNLGVETRVLGTFGYLAPEYAQSGQITEKADVYSFGVVLVELITGRKAVDINRPKGQQYLTEWDMLHNLLGKQHPVYVAIRLSQLRAAIWHPIHAATPREHPHVEHRLRYARPLLDEFSIEELIDPCLENRFSEHELQCMLHAASLCIQREAHARPKMSQVLRILGGDLVMEPGYSSKPGNEVGRNRRFHQSSPIRHRRANSIGGEQSYESPRTDWERDGEGKATFLRR